MNEKLKVFLTVLVFLILLSIIFYQNMILIKSNPRIKAAFIYINDISDFGWTYAHESGRIFLKNTLKQVDSIYRESVKPEDFITVVQQLIEKEKCNVIVATSYSYVDEVNLMSDRYPEVIFLSCATETVKKNLIPYMVDLYQIYYLNGLIAGGLTEAGNIGYIGSYRIPEVIRHINAFAIGVNEIRPDIKVKLYFLNSWYNPQKTSDVAKKMLAEGIDAIAYTEDSASIVTTCQDYFTKTMKNVYTFSHYSPMDKFGADVVVSGQLVNWGPLYVNLFSKIISGKIEQKLHYWFACSGSAILGKNYETIIATQFIDKLKNKKITFGSQEITLYDYIINRYKQMKDPCVSFDPFTGSILSKDGKIRINEKERITLDQLLKMDWFVPSIVEKDY